MMFQSKTKRIKQYLAEQRSAGTMSAFDMLLEDHLNGSMDMRLGLEETESHVDWFRDYRCIQLQGKHGKWYVDIQIEPTEFFVDVAEDEPDNPVYYPLESAEQFYNTVEQVLASL